MGSNADRHRANTKEEDPTGLLNEGFRYRDLDTGTFLTRDPMGMVDGPNLYTYVVQNPWTKFDPEGLAEVKYESASWNVFGLLGEWLAHEVAGPVIRSCYRLGSSMEGAQKSADAISRSGGSSNQASVQMGEVREVEVMGSLVPAATIATSVPGSTATGPVSGPVTTATLAAGVRPLEVNAARTVLSDVERATAINVATQTAARTAPVASSYATKVAAREALNNMGLAANQLESALSAVSRATTSSEILITQNADNVVVGIKRAGNDGYQVVESTIQTNGEKTVVQKAYDSTGKLVHNDPKPPPAKPRPATTNAQK